MNANADQRTFARTHTPRPCRVLVAEDDYELASLVVEVLRAEGLDVSWVTSGAALLSALGDPERAR